MRHQGAAPIPANIAAKRGRTHQTAPIMAVILGGVIFAILFWRFQGLHSYLVPAGAALATFFGALPGLVSATMRAKWSAVGLAGALVGVGTWYTTFVSDQEQRDLSTRYTLQQETLHAYLTAVTQEDGDALLRLSGRKLQEQYREGHYSYVSDLAALLLGFDPDNGHGLYYAGEIWRMRRNSSEMRTNFKRYLAFGPGLPASERSGDSRKCYDRAKGYCKERTAYINHLLANNFYAEALRTRDKSNRAADLEEALKYANEALRLWKGGFPRDKTTLATSVIRERATEALKAGGQR